MVPAYASIVNIVQMLLPSKPFVYFFSYCENERRRRGELVREGSTIAQTSETFSGGGPSQDAD